MVIFLPELGFTSYRNEDTHYPDMSRKRFPGKLPAPRGTKAANGHNVKTEGTSNNPAATSMAVPFKMRKFQGVEAKCKYMNVR